MQLKWTIAAALTAAFFASPALAQQKAPDSLPGCQYNATPPTLASGQTTPWQCDINGKLITSGGGGSSTITAGSTPTSGFTSGDLIGSASSFAADSGVPYRGGKITAAGLPTATTGALGIMEVGTGLSVSAGVVTPTFGTATNQVAEGGVITAGGPIGSATVAPIITYNAAGQLTTVSSATITPAIGSVTGLGTGVATALGAAPNAIGGMVTAITAPATWTPTDQSTAGLTFTSVNAKYFQYGNMVFAYGTLTYPTTADTNQAAISLPVAVPNQTYAKVYSSAVGAGTAALFETVPGTSNAVGITAAGVAVTNASFSAKTINILLIYPAS